MTTAKAILDIVCVLIAFVAWFMFSWRLLKRVFTGRLHEPVTWGDLFLATLTVQGFWRL